MTAPMTRAEILALPPATDILTLCRMLDRSEPTIRAAIKSGELEALGIKIAKLGAKHLVITASVWAFLDIRPDGGADSAANEAKPQSAARRGSRSASALQPVRGERC